MSFVVRSLNSSSPDKMLEGSQERKLATPPTVSELFEELRKEHPGMPYVYAKSQREFSQIITKKNLHSAERIRIGFPACLSFQGAVSNPTCFTYQGPLVNGIAEGKGFLLNSHQFLYMGNFFKNCIHDSNGALRFDDGSLYVGNFEKGKRHGAWKLESSDGNTYEGYFEGYAWPIEFLQNLFSGCNKITYPDGSVYEGAVLDRQPHGHGRLTKTNAAFVEGLWVRGALQGIVRVGDGESSFERVYDKGVPIDSSEETSLSLSNKLTYIGPIQNGRLHGLGILIREGNYVYKGRFVQNLCHDKSGVLTLPTGDVYTGVFENGFRQGKWQIRRLDGSLYEGRLNRRLPKEFFAEDLWEGCAKITDSLGRIIYPKEENGTLTLAEHNQMPQGKATIEYPDGRVYTGEIVDGEPQGDGVMKKAGEFEYSGKFMKGLFQGYGVYSNLQTQIVQKGRFSQGEYEEGSWKRTSLTRLPSFTQL